jgi:hypothetical protein
MSTIEQFQPSSVVVTPFCLTLWDEQQYIATTVVTTPVAYW